jgi:peptidoglycan/xylan/chitin deacetylase (PgdA/CDA1 family)
VTESNTRPWAEGCVGAVSLTFDDGRQSQREAVVPLLDQFGLRGTFYLNPRARGRSGGDWREHVARWAPVQAAGHEIGNHSLSHVCSQGHQDAPDPSRPCLEGWSLEDVEADVLEAERRLADVLPIPAGHQGQQRSFCYPCYHEHVGRGTTRQSYVPVIARHFVPGRGRG